jgi:hypothetical protein
VAAKAGSEEVAKAPTIKLAVRMRVKEGVIIKEGR